MINSDEHADMVSTDSAAQIIFFIRRSLLGLEGSDMQLQDS